MKQSSKKKHSARVKILQDLADKRRTKLKTVKQGKQASLPTTKMISFDTFYAAKSAKEDIEALCAQCDQVNVVIREEGNQSDPDILEIDGKVMLFAGEAWYIVHQRRLDEGWYGETVSESS